MKKKSFIFVLLFFCVLGFCGCSKTCTVSFDTDGGSYIESVQVANGEKISRPEDPTKDGYIFDGWYVSNTSFTEDYKWSFLGYTVSENMTLYAKWIAKDEIKVEFNTSGGEGYIYPIYLTFDSSYGELSESVVKTGFKFAGWWTGENGTGTQITSDSIVKNSSNHTLYAKWEKLCDGDGTETSPYTLTSKQQLFDFAKQVRNGDSYEGKYIVLTGDVDLDGDEWAPIGFEDREFKGIFNGCGNVVRNFKIETPRYSVGFFGTIGGAVIKNLGVENFNFRFNNNVYSTNLLFTGGLVGHNNDGIIDNCYAVGNIDITSKTAITAGGLIGFNHNESNVSNCFSVVQVSMKVNTNNNCRAGGLIGWNCGTVSNCVAIGDVTSCLEIKPSNYAKPYSGGIIGVDDYNKFENIFKFDGQQVGCLIENEQQENNDSIGSICTLEQLNSVEFYQSTLQWDMSIWDFSNLDISLKQYPILKH